MASYNYRDGKKRIEDILNLPNDTEKSDRIPAQSAFSFGNGYYGYVTAVFVDICKSTELFNDSSIKRTTRAKIVRSFTSEVIEILRKDSNLRDIGIRGDCVFAIYTSPSFLDDYEILDKAVYVNSFSRMLNALLERKQLDPIEFGIGISTGNELVVKAGREGAGINDLVWIGKAVTYASHFSSLANRKGRDPIFVSNGFYNNIKRASEKENPNGLDLGWFTDFNVDGYSGKQCNIIKTEMCSWVEKGMPND